MLVSVIVPVYKVEKYIHRCVDSILAQTFRDFELILVDDGSPDSCGAICEEYAAQDSRVHVIHRENGGLSAARNSGIEWALDNSDSQYLTFIDSDDWVHPEMLERLLNQLSEHDSSVAICQLRRFASDEDLIRLPTLHGESEIFNGKEACIHLYSMDGKTSIEACAKLYKKHLFQNVRFPIGKVHEDQAIVPKLYYYAVRVVSIKDPLYFYFYRESSIIGQGFSKKRFDDIDALNDCIQFFRDHGETLIVQLAEGRRGLLWGMYLLMARRAKKYDDVPQKYKLSLWRTIREMEKKASFDKVTWYMAKAYPEWVKPYSYWCKLRKTFGIQISAIN